MHMQQAARTVSAVAPTLRCNLRRSRFAARADWRRRHRTPRQWAEVHRIVCTALCAAVKQILIGVQELLDTPNNADPANGQASQMCLSKKDEYRRKTRNYAASLAQ